MKNKKGFTLIELLVTILIISILAGITIPISFSIIRNNEKKADVENFKLLEKQFSLEVRNRTSRNIEVFGGVSGPRVIDAVSNIVSTTGYIFSYSNEVLGDTIPNLSNKKVLYYMYNKSNSSSESYILKLYDKKGTLIKQSGSYNKLGKLIG